MYWALATAMTAAKTAMAIYDCMDWGRKGELVVLSILSVVIS